MISPTMQAKDAELALIRTLRYQAIERALGEIRSAKRTYFLGQQESNFGFDGLTEAEKILKELTTSGE